MSEIIRLTFLGDISLNDDYADVAKSKTNPFSQVREFLSRSDLVIGNFEAVMKGRSGENQRKQTRLRIERVSLDLLRHLNLKVLSLANNHIYDQLLDGFCGTIDFLDRENISYLGACRKGDEEKSACIKNVKGKKIAFLNYVHPDTNPLLPEDCAIVVNIYDRNRILSEIERLRMDVDCVVLLLHWGLDNSRFPEPWQRRDARQFAEAGADIIVGHHSHVLQGYEKVGQSWVFYSLGNFAFSRHFNNNQYYELGNRQRESIILDMLVGDGKVSLQMNPVKLQGLAVVPIRSHRAARLSFMIPFVSNRLIWPFYKFYLNVIHKLIFYFLGNGRNPFLQLIKIDKRRINRMLQLLGMKK